MRFSITASILTAITICSSVMSAKILPAYQHLYSLTLILGENHQVEGPMGTRYGLGLIGYANDHWHSSATMPLESR